MTKSIAPNKRCITYLFCLFVHLNSWFIVGGFITLAMNSYLLTGIYINKKIMLCVLMKKRLLRSSHSICFPDKISNCQQVLGEKRKAPQDKCHMKNKCLFYYTVRLTLLLTDEADRMVNTNMLSHLFTVPSQLAFYVNLHRAVIGPSATLTGRWQPDIDLRRMLTGIWQKVLQINNFLIP